MASIPANLAPPVCAFASDNAAGAHPRIIEAVVAANTGHELAYGDDPHTRRCEQLFNDLFGATVTTLLTFNGTGANVLALATALGPSQGVLCTQWSHIAVDETGAPERVLGAKLIDLASVDAKLTPADIAGQVHHLGVMHHVQPGVVSLTQSTELGTVYTPEEIAELCAVAHRHGMLVHLDGARIANAVAAHGGGVHSLRAMTIEAGVDVVSFGGTKNGFLGGEAVIICNPALAKWAPYLRKQVTQLPSKMRFVAAQFNAALSDDLWITTATHANQMARQLYDQVRDLPGLTFDAEPIVNAVFPCLPDPVIDPLREWCFFWDWDRPRSQVRWMTAWDTTPADVERFVAGLQHLLTQVLPDPGLVGGEKNPEI
jgi:threonine aldolase